MKSNDYYLHQTQARGLTSKNDVEALCRAMSPVWERILIKWLPQSLDSVIYEAGCGAGVMMLFLKRLGYKNISGTDISQSQVELANASGLPARLGSSIEDLKNTPENSIDCIIAIDFIEHLNKDDAIEFLNISNTRLKTGGCLILRMPNGDSPLVGRNLFNDITHQWAYTTVSINALLKIAGFRKTVFADESTASIQKHRWIKVPIMKIAQSMLRLIIRSATREQIYYLSPSIFVGAWK